MVDFEGSLSLTPKEGQTLTVQATLNVNGTNTLNIGSLTGTIALATGAKLSNSAVYGGAISIANGNSVTFTGTNTFTSVSNSGTINLGTTDAAATLNATGITGGVICAANDLTFVGANTLTGVVLSATADEKTVKVANDSSLTVTNTTFTAGSVVVSAATTDPEASAGTLSVGGTSTLTIGSLDGTITLLDDTTLTNSTVYGGVISVAGSNDDVIFSGANTFTSVSNSGSISVTGTLNATGGIENADSGEITIRVDSQVTANITGGKVILTSEGVSPLGSGMITVVNGTIGDDVTIYDADGYELHDGSLACTIGTGATATKYYLATLPDANGKKTGIFLTTQDRNIMYVNTDYSQGQAGGHIYDYNAYNALNNAAIEAAQADAELVVENGAFGSDGSVIELQFADSVLQKEDNATISFSKAVYSGAKVTVADNVIAGNTVNIETGTFQKFFVGGSNIEMNTSTTKYFINATLCR